MSEHSEEQVKDAEFHQPRLNDVAQKFLADLGAERTRLDETFPLCSLIIDEAIDRVYSTGRIPGKEYYADVYKQKPLKITQKVFVPVKQYPKFNFTGKILGPKGNSLRRLQEETQCKIVIKGRSSIRDRTKEEEMRVSGDPRYSHLSKDLFLEISTVATPAESYARIAYALAEIRKYLVPDKNDEVSHDQLRELMEIDPVSAKNAKRSLLEKKLTTGGGASKYLSIIKQASYDEVEEPKQPEEEFQYEYRLNKRQVAPAYEYVKARPLSIAATYKRGQAPVYTDGIKRLRENPIKTVKPNAYAILNKYK